MQEKPKIKGLDDLFNDLNFLQSIGKGPEDALNPIVEEEITKPQQTDSGEQKEVDSPQIVEDK